MFRKIKAFLVFYKPQSRLKLKSGNLYFKSTLDFLTALARLENLEMFPGNIIQFINVQQA